MLKLLEQDLQMIKRKHSWGGSIVACQHELINKLEEYRNKRVITKYSINFNQNTNTFDIVVQPPSRIQEIDIKLSFM